MVQSSSIAATSFPSTPEPFAASKSTAPSSATLRTYRTRIQETTLVEEQEEEELEFEFDSPQKSDVDQPHSQHQQLAEHHKELESSLMLDQESVERDADHDVLMRTPLGRVTNIVWTRRASSSSSISSIGKSSTAKIKSKTNRFLDESSQQQQQQQQQQDGSSLDFSARMLKRLSIRSNQTETPDREEYHEEQDHEENGQRQDEEEDEDEDEDEEHHNPSQQRVQLLTPLNCVTQERIRRQQQDEEHEHESDHQQEQEQEQQQEQQQRQLRKRRPSASPALSYSLSPELTNEMVFSHAMEPHPRSRVSSGRRAWKRHSRPKSPTNILQRNPQNHPVHGRMLSPPTHDYLLGPPCNCGCHPKSRNLHCNEENEDEDSQTQNLVVRKGLMRQLEQESIGTLIVYQPTCLDHHNDTHQENRQRLKVLCGPDGVLSIDRFSDLQWANLKELRPARLCDLLRVHTFEYVQHLEKSCAALPEQDPSITVGRLYTQDSSSISEAKRKRGIRKIRHHHDDTEVDEGDYASWLHTPKAATCYDVENPPSSGMFDMDSPISKSSYEVARLAAGAVCHAIDKVIHLETRNAFVIVRPPGHHAGPNGCVESEGFHRRPEMCTCGFCLLNNVAIGAAYAMDMYGGTRYGALNRRSYIPRVDRVAIIDFDIHHGNGTEEIIRNLIPHKQKYPLPPSWAPLSFDSYKPWRDENDMENVFFGSIHLFDDDNFYPCSGVGPHGCSRELEQCANIVNLPLDLLGPKYLEERLKLSQKAKRSLMEQASQTFRRKVSTHLLPALRLFGPDLIMISAGFDGHADDFYYFLSEDDYGWITEKLVDVAEDCCQGRIVSVLEGGYNVDAQKHNRRRASKSNFHFAAELHNRDVDDELSPFGSLARSCAAHVTALQQAAAR